MLDRCHAFTYRHQMKAVPKILYYLALFAALVYLLVIGFFI